MSEAQPGALQNQAKQSATVRFAAKLREKAEAETRTYMADLPPGSVDVDMVARAVADCFGQWLVNLSPFDVDKALEQLSSMVRTARKYHRKSMKLPPDPVAPRDLRRINGE